jgi:hypothetical protein
VIHVAKGVGAGLAIAGALGPAPLGRAALRGQGSNGGVLWNAFKPNPASGVRYAAKQVIPLVGTDPVFANNRAAVAGGAGIYVASKYARKIPIVRELRKISIKLDRKLRASLI